MNIRIIGTTNNMPNNIGILFELNGTSYTGTITGIKETNKSSFLCEMCYGEGRRYRKEFNAFYCNDCYKKLMK